MSLGRTEATTADQPIRDEARRTHAEVLRSFTPPGRRPKARNSSADRDPTDMIDTRRTQRSGRCWSGYCGNLTA
jgi:hypothetical protein